MSKIIEIAKEARKAYLELANSTTEQKNDALIAASFLLEKNKKQILKANQQDIENAIKKKLNEAMIDRLKLDENRIDGIIKSLHEIAKLPDPVGQILHKNKRPNGLIIERISIPLGVIGIIYESRPNVTADAWALCMKSGNSAILRPGSESFHSSQKILQYIQQALEKVGLPINSVQMLPTKDRAAINEMLTLDEYIDVIIPRGGRGLIEAVTKNSKIPVFKHLDGNCHSYVHKDADIEKARKIVTNVKLRRPGICGATESLVIDEIIAAKFLPLIIDDLGDCEIRGDKKAMHIDQRVKKATEADFGAEYLDKILSVKIVDDIGEAIEHINKYSSKHTESIITENAEAAKEFLQKIDSAIVMHNSSTQFADGGEFGLGAEIGISTGRLHARGPVGLQQLTTYKYIVLGKGQTRP